MCVFPASDVTNLTALQIGKNAKAEKSFTMFLTKKSVISYTRLPDFSQVKSWPDDLTAQWRSHLGSHKKLDLKKKQFDCLNLLPLIYSTQRSWDTRYTRYYTLPSRVGKFHLKSGTEKHPQEMEKGGRSGRTACGTFSQLFYVLFFCLFCVQFLAFLHVFEHVLHIFCVLIFQAWSFACDICQSWK